MVGRVELGEAVVVPEQAEAAAGNDERDRDLRVHLREAAWQGAHVEKPVLELAEAEEALLGGRVERLGDGPGGFALHGSRLDPPGTGELAQEYPTRGIGKSEGAGRAVDGGAQVWQFECELLPGFVDGGGGRGEFFGKDEAGGRGLGLACETDADGVVQQRLERELSAVDLQCHGAGSRGWRGAQAGEREAAG